MISDDEFHAALERVGSPLSWAFMGAMTGVFFGAENVAMVLFGALTVTVTISILITALKYAKRRGVV